MISFQSFFIFKNSLYLSYLFFCQWLIEEHRYTTPDYWNRIFHDPESYPKCKYSVCPPEWEILCEKECYKYPSIHEKIRRVVKGIRFYEKRIIDFRDTKEVPHDDGCSDYCYYHGDNLRERDFRWFICEKIHYTIVSQEYSWSEYDESFEYRSESLDLPESVCIFFSTIFFWEFECDSIDSRDEHIHKGVEGWSENRKRPWCKTDNRLKNRKYDRYHECKSYTKRGGSRNFKHKIRRII